MQNTVIFCTQKRDAKKKFIHSLFQRTARASPDLLAASSDSTQVQSTNIQCHLHEHM